MREPANEHCCSNEKTPTNKAVDRRQRTRRGGLEIVAAKQFMSMELTIALGGMSIVDPVACLLLRSRRPVRYSALPSRGEAT